MDDRSHRSLEESRAYWDKRAETFGSPCGNKKSGASMNGYAAKFLELLEAPADAKVLDMGCATGTLAIPLASAGCEVVACDFSPKMIEKLEATASEQHLPITCKLMAWEDDWSAYGLDAKQVDIAIASRSFGFGDMRRSLEKLDEAARDIAAITVSAGPVPAYEPRLIEHLGRSVPKCDDVPQIIEMLFAMDRFPHLCYLPCERPMRFADIETARMELSRMVGPAPMSPHEQDLFDRYVQDHFIEGSNEGGTFYQLDYTLTAPWAFIKWSTRGEI